MTLTIQSFFTDYVNHPLSMELPDKDKIIALLCSIILGILTLGTTHLICAALRSRRIRILTEEHKATTLAILNRLEQQESFTVSEDTKPSLQSTDVGEKIQKLFIEPFYKKPLPPKEEVEVSLPGEEQKRKWVDLSREQKVEVNNYHSHPHNQVRSRFLRLFIDQFFMPFGQETYLPTDPRRSHGSDHAARIAIFTPVFAYLYAKYHPGINTLSKKEIVLSQLIGAGHDCARQTEGTDVYDEDSAQRTVGALRKLGIRDPSILAQALFAVQHKDFEDREQKNWDLKPFVAKLVQNADSAEFARLLLSSPVQGSASFDESAKYLDIYKELQALAEQKNGKLKNDLKFQDFSDELNAVRWEMNRLIYITHQKKFREAASQEGKNYYNEILELITPEDFPALFHALDKVGLNWLQPQEEYFRNKAKTERVLTETSSWLAFGIDNIPTNTLQRLHDSLQTIPANKEVTTDLLAISAEITRREEAEKRFEKLFGSKERNMEKVMAAFYSLPPLLKEEYRPFLKDFLSSNPPSQWNKKTSRAFAIEKAHMELCELLTTSGEQKSPSHADALSSKAQEVLNLMKDAPLKRDFRIQTTCAIALEKATLLFVEAKQNEKAREVLRYAETLPIDRTHPITKFLDVSSPLSKPGIVMSLPTDCSSVRKHRLRACEKKIGDQEFIELSFELSPQSRKNLEKIISALHPDEVKNVPLSYFYAASGANSYSPQQPKTVGKDMLFQGGSPVEIRVGSWTIFWNQYNQLRIQVRKGTSPEEVQKALSRIGLPTALMTTRAEDRHLEALKRILCFRFPSMMYSGDPHKDPHKVYDSLPASDRKQVDRDLRNVQNKLVGPYEIEQVLPTVRQEAIKQGAAALGAGICAGDTQATANVLANILKGGLLSSQERFQRGLFGGLVPHINFATGSGNQVFTRVLTKKQFDTQYSIDNFPFSGNIFLLLDLQAYEKMPYSYPTDNSGIRNPEFFLPFYTAFKRPPVIPFWGKRLMAQRLGFIQNIEAQKDKHHPVNEVMFDLTLGPQYIRKVVVQTEEDRSVVLAALRKKKIFDINGIPITECVVASSCLHPGLDPSSKQKEAQPTGETQ